MLRTIVIALLPLLVLGACASSSPRVKDIRTRDVMYEIDGAPFKGVMAWDASTTAKRPGVLVCPEWWGNNDYPTMRAKMLAELGYVAFTVDMYGAGKVTTDPKQAGAWAGEVYKAPGLMRERVVAGLKVLRSDPHVDATRLAAIGYCFGGSVALEAGRSGAAGTDLRAIVCFHTSTLTTDAPQDNASIKGTVLVCHGDADTFVPAGMIANFERQMQDAGVRHEIKRYPGAVHAFTNPGADAFDLPGVTYDKAADEQSWADMKALFHGAL
jgi:dienelactone hydrolase